MLLHDPVSLQSVIAWLCVAAIVGGGLTIVAALAALRRRKMSASRVAIIIAVGIFAAGMGADVLPLAHEMFRPH